VKQSDITLDGVNSRVLASYLKGLAILRIVSEQEGGDREAMAYWDEDGAFHFISTLGIEGLARFFSHSYAPTPIVTPWNGGSGFFPKDQKAGIAAIESCQDSRFSAYRATLVACRALLIELGFDEKPDKELKAQLLRLVRSRLPDSALPWLDAAFAVGDEARFPSLLGSGGNDGRLDFANNFMQRVSELFLDPGRNVERVQARLRAALFAENGRNTYDKIPIGQFGPALSGGSNMSTGVSSASRANPWDFVLALEGATLFAGAAVRRYEAATNGASFPFQVRTTTAGYGSASEADETSARAEIWLPLWPEPASLAAVRLLFSEGRLEVGGKRARNGVNAAQAIASLGVDRGVDRFERVGLLRRNGLAFFATWLGTLTVRHVPDIELLRELDVHLDTARRSEVTAVKGATSRIDGAIYELARGTESILSVVAGLGALQRALARSPEAQKKIRPQPTLQPEWWRAIDSGHGHPTRSPELELAAAFSSWGLRAALMPVELFGDRLRWVDDWKPPTESDPLALVVELGLQALNRSEREIGSLPFDGDSVVSSASLHSLLSGRFDRRLFSDLLHGLALFPRAPHLTRRQDSVPAQLPHHFGLLRAVMALGRLLEDPHRHHPSPKSIARILATLRAGRLTEAAELAHQRLHGSGITPFVHLQAIASEETDYAALSAALLVPLSARVEDSLFSQLIPSIEERKESLS
jgi:CRISPR-associated protein Csx17